MNNLMKETIKHYNLNKSEIKTRLGEFKKNRSEESRFKEFLFCLLTPQSNAKKCWEAVELIGEMSKLKNPDIEEIKQILKTRTRFYNTKAKRIMNAKKMFGEISFLLENKNISELRNAIYRKVDGYGLKEAGHFLRNIGLSDNKIAILDRHILRNLKNLRIIDTDKIKSDKHYLEIEDKFIKFSNKIKIPIDELDLAFWSWGAENGEIFK